MLPQDRARTVCCRRNVRRFPVDPHEDEILAPSGMDRYPAVGWIPFMEMTNEGFFPELPGCGGAGCRRHDLGHRDGGLRGSCGDACACSPQPARLGVAVPVRHLLSSAS